MTLSHGCIGMVKEPIQSSCEVDPYHGEPCPTAGVSSWIPYTSPSNTVCMRSILKRFLVIDKPRTIAG